MKYYRVIAPDKLFRFDGYMQTVKGELFSPGEYGRYSTPDKYGKRLSPSWVEVVEVPKNKVYWFFGARFAFEKEAEQ